ncbi:general odorant-binding protein 28a-like [Haematobia irritans]|uniref:general odorant-binding protein 28a-like n=1 Tax=Haematobia irritans TaxID=7368 RepID=UPI003F508E9E
MTHYDSEEQSTRPLSLVGANYSRKHKYLQMKIQNRWRNATSVLRETNIRPAKASQLRIFNVKVIQRRSLNKMSKIQFLILFGLIEVILSDPIASRDAILRQFQMDSEMCRKKVGATTADVENLLNRMPPTNTAAKCLRSCIMKTYNVMDSRGKFVPSVAMLEAQRLTNGDIEKMKIADDLIRACTDIRVSENDCEAAAEYDWCFREQSKLMGIPQY